MDSHMIRTLLDINAMQTLGSVQTYANAGGTTGIFDELLGELMGSGDSSITEALTSQSASLLSSMGTDSLQYAGINPVFVPAMLSGGLETQRGNAAPISNSYHETGDIANIIKEAAQRFGVPENLISAVIKQESDFNPKALSHAGAAGLMQLMPGTARHLGVTDSFDPQQNVMGGAKYLRQMLDQFGNDVRLALAAYNAGPGNVRKYGGIPPFKETQQYVQKVLGHYQNLTV